MVKKINRICRKIVNRGSLIHGNRTLLNRPKIYTPVRPLYGKKIDRAASSTEIVTSTKLLTATLKCLFYKVIKV